MNLPPCLVKVAKANSIYDIVDTVSGKTIISGYKGYWETHSSDSAVYVYAERADGGYDVYAVK